jgi:hypothetical protein
MFIISYSQEAAMDATRTVNRDLQSIAWGLLFLWWGITALFNFLPEGVGAVGTGMILIGLNAVRLLNGLPTRVDTTTVGILALVLGGLQLARSVLALPFKLPVFAILLLALGVIVLVRELPRIRNE